MCTFNTICDDGEPLSLTETLAGQLYDEDEQCNFHLGGNHYYDDGFCVSSMFVVWCILYCVSSMLVVWCIHYCVSSMFVIWCILYCVSGVFT